MREIEIKAKLKNMASTIEQLVAKGAIVSDPATHHDRVYGLPGENGGDGNHLPWLRIRTETIGDSSRHLFTLKKSVTNQLDSIEHETEIVDDAELEQIILHMGYEPYSDLTKTRRKAKLGDVELCLDEVGELGTFIEAEKLVSEDADYEVIVAELRAVMREYGVNSEDEVSDGYDTMQRRQKGLPLD